MNIEENQYIDLVKDIIANGSREIGRNGKTRVLFGKNMAILFVLW